MATAEDAKYWPDLLRRLNSQPSRAEVVSSIVDPNKLEGYNMLKNLAQMQGPTPMGAIARQQVAFNQGNDMDAASMQAAQQRIAARARGGSRERNAILGTNVGLQGMQTAGMNSGNRLLDALRGEQAQKLGAAGKWADMQIGAAANRNKAAYDLYEQDINRYAATKAAKATAGMGWG